MKTPGEIGRLAQMACVWDVCAPKPGNVSRNRDFNDTSAADFLLSAIAIGPAFEDAENLMVGDIVRRAVSETRRVVRSNTNLGMILLLAPLVKACCGAAEPDDIRDQLGTGLRALSVEDARLAYAAIRMAKPGGMGKVKESDISEEPSITLLQAMTLAQERDSIAREYATDFSITFEIGLPALKSALARGAEFPLAIVHAFLTILSGVPDTLIARKRGPETARRISLKAEKILHLGGVFSPEGGAALEELDRLLCDAEHSLNPGTTADLTTAAIFLALL